MITKCKFCGGALKYDADIRRMVCEYCSSMFDVEDTEEEKEYEKMQAMSAGKNPDGAIGRAVFTPEKGTMDMSLYHCSSCSGELYLNQTEVASYCPYCGQPTIVFERIAKTRKPDYILPFKITKEYAVASIREKFFKGHFIPKELKYFKAELLRGIYVPYYLYDMLYKDRQIIRAKFEEKNSKGEKSSVTYDFYREAVASFQEIPVDASKKIPNEITEKLEPFYTADLIDFQAGYLSGFYADLQDDSDYTLRNIARRRARDRFNKLLYDDLMAKECQTLKSNPTCSFEKETYALLPVWFMVFTYEGDSYTILVNGQTGKVVGGVPSDKNKIALWFSLITLLVSVPAYHILQLVFDPVLFQSSDSILSAMWVPLVLISAAFTAGLKNYRSVRKSQALTRAETIKTLVGKREGRKK